METTKLTNLTQKFPPEQFNLLYPSETVMEISPLQRVSFETIKIDPEKEHGEVYPVAGGKLALSKTALDRLAHTAGIIYDPHLTGRVPTSDMNTIEYRVRGAVQKPDGSWVDANKSVSVDLQVLAEKVAIEIEEKAKSGKLGRWEGRNFVAYKWGTDECKREMEAKIRTETVNAKLFAGRKAESAAYNRVIRSLLGLKAAYTVEELKKPFVVVRVSVNVEKLFSDPATKQHLLHAALNAGSAIFGSSVQPRLELSLPAAPVVSTPTERENLTEEAAAEVLPPSDPNHAPVTAQTEEEYKSHWKSVGRADRLMEVASLVGEKGYAPKAGSRKPESLNDDELVDYLWFLKGLPTPATSERKEATA